MSGILVTKPGTLSFRDRDILRKANIVAIEADDPSSVKLIQPSGQELTGSELLFAAMKALNLWSGDVPDKIRAAFAKAVFEQLNEQREAAKAIPRDASGRFVPRGEQ